MTERRTTDGPALADASPVWAEHTLRYRKFLRDGGYAPSYEQSCVAAVRHFSTWMTQANLGVADTTEKRVAAFLDVYERRGRLGSQAEDRRAAARAALVHYLTSLRASGATAPELPDDTPASHEVTSCAGSSFTWRMNVACQRRPARTSCASSADCCTVISQPVLSN